MSDLVTCPKCGGHEFHGLCALCDGDLEILAEDAATFTLMGGGPRRNRWIRARRRRLGLDDFSDKLEQAETDGKVKIMRNPDEPQVVEEDG